MNKTLMVSDKNSQSLKLKKQIINIIKKEKIQDF